MKFSKKALEVKKTKLGLNKNTVGIRIPDFSGIQMVESCPIAGRSGICMPFEYQTIFSSIQNTIWIMDSEYQTSKSTLFRCLLFRSPLYTQSSIHKALMFNDSHSQNFMILWCPIHKKIQRGLIDCTTLVLLFKTFLESTIALYKEDWVYNKPLMYNALWCAKFLNG